MLIKHNNVLKMIRHDQVVCKLGKQGLFNSKNSIHIIHNINIPQDKYHMIILTDA